MQTIQKPAEGEYAPYAIMYVRLVPADGLRLQHLHDDLIQLKQLLLPLPDEKLSTPCAPGEWTIKEIVGHIIDSERVFAYRALRFARNDTTELPGFDQDLYVASSNANQRSIEEVCEELTAVRMATLALFRPLDATVLARSGVSNGHRTSVRALAYLIAGHALHHATSIKENYF